MLNRIVLFFVFLGIFTASFAVGAEVQVSEEESAIILEEFESLIAEIDAVGIFTHNTLLALPMFIPGFGIAWGAFAAFSTGMAFSVLQDANPMLENIPSLTSPIHVTLWVDGNCSLFDSNVSQLHDRPQDDQKNANPPRCPRNWARGGYSNWTAIGWRIHRILLYSKYTNRHAKNLDLFYQLCGVAVQVMETLSVQLILKPPSGLVIILVLDEPYLFREIMIFRPSFEVLPFSNQFS